MFDYFGKNANELIDRGLVDEASLKNILKNIKKGGGHAFESKTAKALLDNDIPITEVSKTVDVKGRGGGRKGEIDVGTNEFIIECFDGTTNTSKNAGDFLKYFEGHADYKYMNPNGKKVILYSSHPIDINKVKDIESLGVIIINDQETLIKTIKGGTN